MLFSYNWLQSYFQKKLPKPEKLAELLTMHSFEIEGIKKIGNDYAIDIDILANRVADCCGHIGIAREIGAILKMKTKGCHPDPAPFRHSEPAGEESRGITARPFATAQGDDIKNCLKIENKEPKMCQRYTAAIVEGVKIGQSPKWMQERLKICGLRPINNIVDTVNYVMLETGQPMHAFDFDKITTHSYHPDLVSPCHPEPVPSRHSEPAGEESRRSSQKKIIIRKAKAGERITSLDEKEYELDKDILIIADNKEPLAIAGVKGGKKAEIDKNTKTIILEAVNFEPSAIRKARQRLNLQTDASFRFEHNLDPNLTEPSINRVAVILSQQAKNPVELPRDTSTRPFATAQGDNVLSSIIDIYPKKVLSKKIKLDLDYMERLLGAKIPKKEIITILKSLGFQGCAKPRLAQQYENGSRTVEVLVPTFRQDVSIQEDLIEEIARIYGYDKIPSVLSYATLIPPEKNYEIFWKNAIKNILKETGFSEVYNYSFISPKQADKLDQLSLRGASDSKRRSNLVEVQNPVSKEQKYMRPSLMPNLLQNVEQNLKNFDSVKIFEIGKVFGIKEKTMLAGVMTAKDSDEGFYEMKGVVDLLFNKLGISDIRYDAVILSPSPPVILSQPSPVILSPQAKNPEDNRRTRNSEKCAEIKIGSQKIGFLGEVGEKIIAFDIDFEKLVKLCSEEHEYQIISVYPSAVRDLAILVPQTTKVVDVINKINTTGGKIIRDVDIFDIYAGSELPDGKKNFAFHIIYQAQDRTLSNEEIDSIHKKIMCALEKNPAWQVRR